MALFLRPSTTTRIHSSAAIAPDAAVIEAANNLSAGPNEVCGPQKTECYTKNNMQSVQCT